MALYPEFNKELDESYNKNVISHREIIDMLKEILAGILKLCHIIQEQRDVIIVQNKRISDLEKLIVRLCDKIEKIENEKT